MSLKSTFVTMFFISAGNDVPCVFTGFIRQKIFHCYSFCSNHVGEVKDYDDDDGDDDDDDDDHVGDVKDYDDSKRSPVAACKHRPVSLLASSVPNLICEECGIVLVILIIFLLGLSLSFIIAL